MLSTLQRSLLIGLLCLACPVRAELPEGYQVVLLTENLPPFNMAVDEKNFARDDAIDGISAVIVREVFKRAGIQYTLSLRFPWDRLYRLTQSQANYGLFSTTYTPEREALFKWVGPLARSSWVLLAPPGSGISLGSLEEAAGYRIGAYKNDAVSQYLESRKLAPANLLRDQDNVERLMKGEIDLWATTEPAGGFLARQQGVSGLATVLRFHEAELFLALNRDTPDEVVERLQKALEELRGEGFVEEVTRRYL